MGGDKLSVYSRWPISNKDESLRSGAYSESHVERGCVFGYVETGGLFSHFSS